MHDQDRIDWGHWFWSKVHPEALSGCWLWHGTVNVAGYGYPRDMDMPHKPYVLAHRWSYAKTKSDVPAGAHVLHRCDVPACVNPAHLFLGSDKDNSDDKVAKGRHAFGERNGHARLTVADVKRIVAQRGLVSAVQLGREHGVTANNIQGIWAGRFWGRVTGIGRRP